MMKKIIILGLLFLFAWASYGQKTLHGTVNFESNSHEISKSDKAKLASIVAQDKIEKIKLEGHTDDKGSEGFNINLSRDRVEAVADYLQELGIDRATLETSYFGESSPAQPNENELGKAENRRVDFTITYAPKEETVTIELEHLEDSLPKDLTLNNSELYAYLSTGNKAQYFRISTLEDTVVKTKDGLIFYFKKGSFDTDCEEVEVQITEYNSRSSMVMGNMQTVADGSILFSVGMFDMNVFCEEGKISLKKEKDYVMFSPVTNSEEAIKGVKYFYGEKNLMNNEVNWVADAYPNVNVVRSGLFCDGPWVDQYIPKKRCFLKKWIMSRKTKEAIAATEKREKEGIRLRNRFQYMNFMMLCSSLGDPSSSYYALQLKGMSLVNYDAFMKMNPAKLVTQRILVNDTISDNTDVKMVFKHRRSMISPTRITNQYFEFQGVPRGEEVFIVGLALDSYSNKSLRLGIKKITLQDSSIPLKIEKMDSKKEFGQRLAVIDKD